MAITAPLNIERVLALPATLTGSTMYIVKSSEAGLVDLYFTNASGSEARHVISKSEITSLIASAVSSLSTIYIAATIAARDALVFTANAFTLVIDATADTSVASGAALYLWDNTAKVFAKVAEYESLDLVLKWADLQDKPTSSVADIDDAVSKKHAHANAAKLDKVGEDANGLFTYNSEYPTAALAKAEW